MQSQIVAHFLDHSNIWCIMDYIYISFAYLAYCHFKDVWNFDAITRRCIGHNTTMLLVLEFNTEKQY